MLFLVGGARLAADRLALPERQVLVNGCFTKAPSGAQPRGHLIQKTRTKPCLKLEVDRLKKHEDELNFFALELQSRRVEQGLVRGLPIALMGFYQIMAEATPGRSSHLSGRESSGISTGSLAGKPLA
jgi:hypothetical protein